MPPPSRHSKSQRSIRDSEDLDASSSYYAEISSKTDILELVNNCVRYLINNSTQNWFRKAEIQNNISCPNNKQFEAVIKDTQDTLLKVYGFNLILCENTGTAGKAYLLSNALPLKTDPEECTSKDKHNILLLLILSHIFMSKNSISSGNLMTFLDQLKIVTDGNDPTFGNVKTFINDLVKHKFLLMETDPATKRSSYSWGPRALNEISKHKILKFVCGLYNEENPKVWHDQYRDAETQDFKNTSLVDSNSIGEPMEL